MMLTPAILLTAAILITLGATGITIALDRPRLSPGEMVPVAAMSAIVLALGVTMGIQALVTL